MQTQFSKLARVVLGTAALAAALATGTALATENVQGLLECDHGCTVQMHPSAGADLAHFQIISATPLDVSAYVSNGPGEIGFTR